tara:strand:- start:734 stop:1198 length:465 start_codon:yes stop_codon:yes gene_type:complete
MATELEWGKATWYFFHTIIEKVSDDFFMRNKKDIFFMIKNICYNLPCPECCEHAKSYTNSIDINKIYNKEMFRLEIFNFHNSVNRALEKPLFEYKNLQNYKNANLNLILNNFLITFRKRYGTLESIGLDSNEISRKKVAKNVELWCFKNWNNLV